MMLVTKLDLTTPSPKGSFLPDEWHKRASSRSHPRLSKVISALFDDLEAGVESENWIDLLYATKIGSVRDWPLACFMGVKETAELTFGSTRNRTDYALIEKHFRVDEKWVVESLKVEFGKRVFQCYPVKGSWAAKGLSDCLKTAARVAFVQKKSVAATRCLLAAAQLIPEDQKSILD